MASQRIDEVADQCFDAERFKQLYVLVEDMEPFERYCPGGYHPARIGDRLSDRYQIVHKLGFGSSSTT